MPICSAYGCSESDESSKRLHFYRFPNREKSPNRHKKWIDFCKRKNFKPSKTSRLCSKHFKLEDFNQSDVLREKLMPDTKVRINLNSGVIPTLRSEKIDLLPSKRDLRVKRRYYTETASLIPSSTPEKSMLVEKYNGINFSDTSLDIDILEELINPNDKSVQCEIGKDIYTNLEVNDDLSFDFLSESSDESCSSDSEADINCSSSKKNNRLSLTAKNNFENDSCFIVFWNCLLELFTHCRQCSGKVTSKQHFIQGALLSVSTLCENGHRLQWYSQPKVSKRPEGNILIGGALTLSGILFNQFKAFCTAIKLSMFTRPVFDKIINKYVYPVICHQWQEHKNANINSIMSSELPNLAGRRRSIRLPWILCKILYILCNGYSFWQNCGF